MLFWIVAALLTLAAIAAVMAPFLRSRPAGDAGRDHDLRVYKDQIEELERDRARGLIGADEAAQARAELGRRILAASERSGGRSTRSAGSRYVAAAALLAAPVVAWGVYAAVGAAGMPAQPLQARLERSPEQATITELVARAERHLTQNPEDGRGWTVVAPIYLRIGRTADAVTAYRNAIRFSPPSAALQSGLGEAIVTDAGGAIVPEAVEAFRQALVLDQRHVPAIYFLAGAEAQAGRTAEAQQMLQRIVAIEQQGSPWRAAATQALADLGAQAPGPTAEQVEAASNMTPAERTAMIENMVEGLAERMRQEPGDAEGWIRLVRSLQVLGRPDDAATSLRQGLAALADAPEKAERLRQAAAEAGLNVEELLR